MTIHSSDIMQLYLFWKGTGSTAVSETTASQSSTKTAVTGQVLAEETTWKPEVTPINLSNFFDILIAFNMYRFQTIWIVEQHYILYTISPHNHIDVY